jgi:hypothetical protein
MTVGGFIGGLQQGANFREGRDSRAADRARQERLDQINEEQRLRGNRRQDESDGWARDDQEYLQSERARQAADRAWIRGIYEDGADLTDDSLTGTAPASAQPPNTGAPTDASVGRVPSPTPNSPPAPNRLTPDPAQPAPSIGNSAPDQPSAPVLGMRPAVPGGEMPLDRQAPPQIQDPAARGVQPSNIPSRTSSNAADAAAMQDPAFVTMAGREGMEPAEYWQTLPPEVQQRHRDRVAGQSDGPAIPDAGTDMEFDQRVVTNASRMLDAGTDPTGAALTPRDAERLRTLINERTAVNADGTVMPTDREMADRAANDQVSAQTSLGARRPDPDAAPAPPAAVQPIGAPRQPSQMQTPAPQDASPDFMNAERGAPYTQPNGAPNVPDAAALSADPAEIAAAVPDTSINEADARPTGLGTRTGAQSQEVETSAQRWIDQYREIGAPHIVEQLMRRGMVAEAEQYQTWIDKETVEAGMRDYARAAMGATTGDFELFGSSILDLYNNEEYFGDGLQIDKENSDFIRDGEGNILGAEITFNDADGNSFTRRWESLNEIVEEAMLMFAPERAFELQLERGDAAAASKAQSIADDTERDVEFMDFMRREIFTEGLSKDDETSVADALEAVQDSLLPGQWSAMSNDDKLAAILEQVQLVRDAEAATSGRPASAGVDPAATAPTPQPNVLRR